jgi:hypothetical protein
MGTNKHAEERVKSGHATPPSGRNDMTDSDHTLRAGKQGPTQRKSAVEREPATREDGRDERRSGSDSGRP